MKALSDIEMVRACAVAMGLKHEVNPRGEIWIPAWEHAVSQVKTYDPLHDDAQAMALVKKFRLSVEQSTGQDRPWDGQSRWYVYHGAEKDWSEATDLDLNRAICECVANLGIARDSERGEGEA